MINAKVHECVIKHARKKDVCKIIYKGETFALRRTYCEKATAESDRAFAFSATFLAEAEGGQ